MRGREREERGAVAIMAVILMGLLLITGALAADMGNAWARKRDMQTQADVAVISAANWGKDMGYWPADTEPEKTAITQKAADYIVEGNNSAIGMTQTTAAQVFTALTDGEDANGDIEFAADGTDVRLIPPPATVQFGLATAFGYSSTDVSAAAKVRLFSEVPNSDVVPLYIPDNCSFGAVEADTTGGNANNPAAGPSPGTFGFGVDPASGATGASGAITFTVPEAESNKNHTPKAVFTAGDTEITIAGEWLDTEDDATDWTFTVTVGPGDITQTDTTWSLVVQPKNNNTSASQEFIVGAGTPVTDPDEGCSGPDQGKFGQLNSPRKGYGLTARSTRLQLNMQDGLDHALFPYPNAPSDSCEAPAGQAAAQLDDDANRDGNNCIKGDQGNDGPAFADALLGPSGRLRSSNGATKSGCGRSDDGAYNNDDLSCYLLDGTTAAEIAQPTGVTQDMLDPTIVNSPRFIWIPVVYADDRSINDYQPILKFVPGLITSQTMTQSADEFDAANPGFHNGVECNGNSWPCNSLSRIKVFTFNPDALPDSANSPVVDYDPDVGRETVRLIE